MWIFFSFPLREIKDVKMLVSLKSLCCLCLCVEFCLQGCLTTYIFFKMIGFKIVHMDVCVPGWRYMRHLYVYSKDERLLYPWNNIAGSYNLLSPLRTEVLSTSEAASFLDCQAISTLHLDYKSIWNDIIFHHSDTLEIITSVLNHCWKHSGVDKMNIALYS